MRDADGTGREGLGTRSLGFIGNVVCFVFLGIWLAIGHVFAAMANAVAIISIPFAWQQLKLAGISLAPIGTAIVDKNVAEEARRRRAGAKVDRTRWWTQPRFASSLKLAPVRH